MTLTNIEIEKAWLRPVAPWVRNRTQLYTLYEMLTFAGREFTLLMGRLPKLRYETLGFAVNPLGHPIEEVVAVDIEAALRDCFEYCNGLRMHHSKAAVRRLLDTLRSLDLYEAERALKEIESRIHDELESQLFFYVPADEAAYFNEPNWIGIEVLLKFPSVEWEATEAGSSYALQRYTACVFHLMRILEYGLAALASALGVSVTNPNWHQILLGCESRIKDLQKHDPNWKQNEQFFNAAALEFRHFQRALRNHTAHVHEKYSASDAKTAMDHVGSFMKHLSERLSEVPMP
jgi:hypothetical protein